MEKLTKSSPTGNNMAKYIATIVVEGKFTEWERLKEYCDQTMTDSAGIALGIITRRITTEIGVYPVKFVLTYFDEGMKHRFKHVNRFKIDFVMKSGFDSILEEIGKKLLINLHLRQEPSERITK